MFGIQIYKKSEIYTSKCFWGLYKWILFSVYTKKNPVYIMIPHTNTHTFISVRIPQNYFCHECEVRAE